MKTGDIVQHKLTKEKMLVLSYDGWGISYTPKTRVRTKDMKELILDTDELEPGDTSIIKAS